MKSVCVFVQSKLRIGSIYSEQKPGFPHNFISGKGGELSRFEEVFCIFGGEISWKVRLSEKTRKFFGNKAMFPISYTKNVKKYSNYTLSKVDFRNYNTILKLSRNGKLFKIE